MASNDYYHPTPSYQDPSHSDLLPYSSSQRFDESNSNEARAMSPFNDHTYPLQHSTSKLSFQPSHSPNEYGHDRDPFADSSAIALNTQYPKNEQYNHGGGPQVEPDGFEPVQGARSTARHGARSKIQSFFSWSSPWVVYFLTLVQIVVFFAELGRNASLTGSPIEIKPQFNPLIGPSPYVLINMGSRYVPCMRRLTHSELPNLTTAITWPCPNSTSSEGSCQLSTLCGFSGVPDPGPGELLWNMSGQPNQWFRFITPIFLHGGVIHILFNMLVQVLLGREVERSIGHLRFFILYFSAGIFGFVLSANYAGTAISSVGASGAIFGIIGLTLLDLFYTWPSRKRPIVDLSFILLDIIVCLVIGLLPGVDNFAHIGGLLVGLGLGLTLLHSPEWLRKKTDQGYGPYGKVRSRHDFDDSSQQVGDGVISRLRASAPAIFRDPAGFFKGRKPLWWVWWVLRAATLIAVIAGLIALLRTFYDNPDQCNWCKYLSCLPVKNWCDQHDIGSSIIQTPAPTGS